MKKYVILNIEDNPGTNEGRLLIVEANPVREIPMMDDFFDDELDDLPAKGKYQYRYNSTKSYNTETFLFPYDDELNRNLINVARKYTSNIFWQPNMDDFFDGRMRNPDGSIIDIHKSKAFMGYYVDNYRYPTPNSSKKIKELIADDNYKKNFLLKNYEKIINKENVGDDYDILDFVIDHSKKSINFFAWLFDKEDFIGLNEDDLPDEYQECWNDFANSFVADGIRQKKAVPVGVKGVVDYFARRMVNPQTFKSSDKISKVKNVELLDGATYTGEALVVGNYCMPNGYGVKIYKSENNKRIVSFFGGGGIGSVAYLSYPKHHMYIGGAEDERSHGWGFYLAKGQYTFGYYKEGKLYKDMTVFANNIFDIIHEEDWNIGPIRDEIYGMALGILPNANRPFTGFQFFENGTVYIGEGDNNNIYDITGRFLRLDIDGTAVCGIFRNGVLDERISQQNFYADDELIDVINNIDLNSDYLKEGDSGLYRIISTETRYDFDMGPLLLINAIKNELVEYDASGAILTSPGQIEYFYLQSDDNINQLINNYAGQHQLWKVNLDDFHTHFDEIMPDLDEMKSLKLNIHIHNEIIGLEYTDVVNFV